MRFNKKGAINPSGFNAFWRVVLGGVVAIVLLVVLFYGGEFLVKKASTIGSEVPSIPIDFGKFDWIGRVLLILFGAQAIVSWQGLLLSLGFALILGMAMSDIMVSFSTFEKGTSAGIGWGLALIASILGVTSALWEYMVAGVALTAMAIFALFIVIILGAVIVNFAFGHLLGRVRLARKIENEANKTQLGAEVAKNAIKGLGTIGQGLASNANQRSP